MTMQPDADLKERLRFLCRITLKEIDLLITTTERLFPEKEPVTVLNGGRRYTSDPHSILPPCQNVWTRS